MREPIVITMQNGLDNDVNVMEVMPAVQVYPGVVYVVYAKACPGVIEQTAGPRKIFFGGKDNPGNEALRFLEVGMRAPGIDAVVAENIESEIWENTAGSWYFRE